MLTIRELIDVLDLLKRCGFPQTRWHELGLRLGLYKNTLDVIEMNHPHNVDRQLMECLSQWLYRADNVDSKGEATFDSLSDALKFMNENAAADKLDQESSALKIMATGGDAPGGDINCQPGIEHLNEVITTLERSDFPADRWSDLGLRLHITQPKLDTLRADNPQNAKACLKGCLKIWLQQDYDVDTFGKPSLEKLEAAVKEMGLRAVADKILEKIKSEGSSEKREDNDLDLPRISDTIESDVYKEFHDLKSTFADIVAKIREHLEAKVKRIARFVEEYLDSEDIMLTNEVSIDILFKRIKSHYSYLSCRLIEAIVDKHVDKSCQLQEEWKTYIKRMNRFKKSKRLKDLQSTIEKSYDRIISSTDTACVVVIKLSGGWDEKTISDLESLLRHYFEDEEIFNHLRITPGSVCISYLVPHSAIAHITSAVKSKSESMRRVGVFYFSINGDVLLDEKDNVNFDKSLIEAIKLDKLFEVSLLLSLGADPYFKDSNGDKVLEFAVQGGNEEIIELITVATDTQVIELESQEELTDEEDKETGNNGENKTLKVEIQRLQDLNAELEKSLAASKSEIDKLQETISFQKKETEAELQTCKKQRNASYLENERLDRVLDKARDDSRVLQNTISSLEANILSLRNELIIKEKILFEQTEQIKSGTEEIAILQEKISSLSIQLIDQPSRIVPRIDKFTQSEAITTMDQSVQSMEILLPEIDRNQMKIEGILTIDDLVDLLDSLKRCGFPETKWYDLGLRLGLRKNTLDLIEAKHRGDVPRCMTECLSQWLGRADNVDSRGGATWDSLSDALKSMNETAVAEKLNQEQLLPALAVSLYIDYIYVPG